MVRVALSIGSNDGDRRANIHRMELALGRILAPPIIMSTLMETEPVDVSDEQPWYFNRIIGGNYGGNPFELLAECCTVERNLGRVDKGTGKCRTADIDILLFGDMVLVTPELSLPHHAIQQRRFCLEGLSQVMPEMVVGAMETTVTDLFLAMDTRVRNQQLHFIVSEGGTSDD